jgi:hypothetical protein
MGIEKIFHLKAPWDRLARLAFIALAYFVAARLGLLFVVQPENFAGIWPASGVALAALLLSPWTERFAVLVVIFAVNALSNLTTGNSLAVSAGFALANTLEPALGSWLLVRYAGRRITFTRLKDLTGLLGVVIFANAITALIGAVVPALSFNTLYWSRCSARRTRRQPLGELRRTKTVRLLFTAPLPALSHPCLGSASLFPARRIHHRGSHCNLFRGSYRRWNGELSAWRRYPHRASGECAGFLCSRQHHRHAALCHPR